MRGFFDDLAYGLARSNNADCAMIVARRSNFEALLGSWANITASDTIPHSLRRMISNTGNWQDRKNILKDILRKIRGEKLVCTVQRSTTDIQFVVVVASKSRKMFSKDLSFYFNALNVVCISPFIPSPPTTDCLELRFDRFGHSYWMSEHCRLISERAEAGDPSAVEWMRHAQYTAFVTAKVGCRERQILLSRTDRQAPTYHGDFIMDAEHHRIAIRVTVDHAVARLPLFAHDSEKGPIP